MLVVKGDDEEIEEIYMVDQGQSHNNIGQVKGTVPKDMVGPI